MKIKIEKINEVHMRVICDEPSIENAIRDRYTFLVPNYMHMPKYKANIWDGKIRLYNFVTKELYLGLLQDLLQYCKLNNIEVEYLNEVHVGEELSAVKLQAFIDYLKLPYPPYDYQFNSVLLSINTGRLTIVSPTSSGKSLIIYIIAMYNFAVHGRKTLMVVPTIALCNQMFRDFKEYSHDAVTEDEFKIHNSTVKKNDDFDFPFVISTWQSIYKNKKSWYDKFDVIIADECHAYKSDETKKMMEATSGVPFKFGLTATLSNDMYEVSTSNSPNTMTLMGLFGGIYRTVSTRELQDRKIVADLFIKIITCEYDNKNKKLLQANKYDYSAEMKIIGINKERRNLVINTLQYTKGNSILLFNFRETFGLPLYEDIVERFPNHKVFYVDGKTKVDDRILAQQTADLEDNVIIVASYGVFQQGISIKNVHNIFLVTPYKSPIRLLQSIGRGLRVNNTKKFCNLYDFVDDLSGNRSNTTLNHAKDRLKVYITEKFNNIKKYNFKFKGD